MVTDFRLPASEDILSTARIAAWRKGPGDMIQAGEVLMEVVTEKVNVEVECSVAGRVIEILGTLDDEITVGDVVARIETSSS